MSHWPVSEYAYAYEYVTLLPLPLHTDSPAQLRKPRWVARSSTVCSSSNNVLVSWVRHLSWWEVRLKLRPLWGGSWGAVDRHNKESVMKKCWQTSLLERTAYFLLRFCGGAFNHPFCWDHHKLPRNSWRHNSSAST